MSSGPMHPLIFLIFAPHNYSVTGKQPCSGTSSLVVRLSVLSWMFLSLNRRVWRKRCPSWKVWPPGHSCEPGTCSLPCMWSSSAGIVRFLETPGCFWCEGFTGHFPLSCEILRENHCLYFLESYVLPQPGKVEYSRMISNRKGSYLDAGLMLYWTRLTLFVVGFTCSGLTFAMALSWSFLILLKYIAGFLFWVFMLGVLGIIGYGRYHNS